MRKKLGEHAANSALRYRPDRIRAQWEELIAELAARPGREHSRSDHGRGTLHTVR
ncbi:hypothetical protein ABZ953_30300 [Streptomyces sp. NPDC046465]|uniref:hypothetical protein n=1 Tax=Streptomyces sp. NPDC046465 TaxID=3155810 RepID=UPI00340E540F